MDRTSGIPHILQAPPTGPKPPPPVLTREQYLPFDKLTWEDFERLIVRLIRRKNEIIDSHLYGAPGQHQNGIDILAIPDDPSDSQICIQCKKVAAITPATINATVTKFLDGSWASQVNEFIFCIATHLRTTKQQNEISKQRTRLSHQGIKLKIWDASPASLLCELLKDNPDLVDDFFGRQWVKHFNGDEAAQVLGDRLSGDEAQKLRARLFKLYSTIFMQHDPGIHIDTKHAIDYQFRYVPADILEEDETAPRTDKPPLPERPQPTSNENVDPHFLDSTLKPATSQSFAFESRRPVLTWLDLNSNSLILGNPGSGKSVLLRFIALSLLNPHPIGISLIEPKHLDRIPVWVSFARLTNSIRLNPELSIEDFFQNWLHQFSFSDIYPLFVRAVAQGRVILLIDGLDESISDHLGVETLDRIIAFSNSHDTTLICTSRPTFSNQLQIPTSWNTATLARLDDKQIVDLASRWFSIVESSMQTQVDSTPRITDQVLTRSRSFLRAAKDNQKTLELSRTPLLCQVLITLFRFSHQLPEARTTAYSQILDLLLSKHPAARAQAGGVEEPSRRAGLQPGNLRDILVRVAWALQIDNESDYLTFDQCSEICLRYLQDDEYGLGLQVTEARNTAPEVVTQLTTRYGVLVERGPKELTFLHLSIQEFLAAESLTQQTHDQQLEFLSKRWIDPMWRESLLCWFGILGFRRDVRLVGQAISLLERLGKAGAWEGMSALEVLAEIATSDLRIPLSESRRIVNLASDVVETSAFREHRVNLARSIAAGALGSTVQAECRERIRSWIPGQTWQKRIGLLRAFRSWRPTQRLQRTLVRGLHDEDLECRRVAAGTLGSLFSDCQDTFNTLCELATGDVRPEVRASSLRGLSSSSKWSKASLEAARINAETRRVELTIEVLRVRIQQGLQTLDDFYWLWDAWSRGSMGYRFSQDLVDLLCTGWPSDPTVRQAVIQGLESPYLRTEAQALIRYLARCYPRDDGIAEDIGRYFRAAHIPGVSLTSDLWRDLQQSFGGHAAISASLREALASDERRERGNILIPPTALVYSVLGDDEARDTLLRWYTTRARHYSERVRIADSLNLSWGADDSVRRHFREWAHGDLEISAPLSKWIGKILSDSSERERWLRMIADESIQTHSIDAALGLLGEFPDYKTMELCQRLIKSEKIWYYHRVRLKGQFARAFPHHPISLDIVSESLQDIDGPSPGDFADVFQSNSDVSERLLNAAVCTPVDVRMAVASLLGTRAADYSSLVELTPNVLAEETGGVRSSCVIARARAARGSSSDVEEVSSMLFSEISALGMYMQQRSRAALSGLLELDLVKESVERLIASDKTTFRDIWYDDFAQDPIAIRAMIQRWDEVEPYLRQNGLPCDIEVGGLLQSGYLPILERFPAGVNALDRYLAGDPPEIASRAYLEARARRQLDKSEFRDYLVELLTGALVRRPSSCAAARILAHQFVSFPNLRIDLPPSIVSRLDFMTEELPGVVGHLCLVWPELLPVIDLGSAGAGGDSRWAARDRLLISVAVRDSALAEIALRDMLSVPPDPRFFDVEDVHAVRLWLQSKLSGPLVAKWLTSNDPVESLSAISFQGGISPAERLEIDTLVRQFNDHMQRDRTPPMDGLNPENGLPTTWAMCMYSMLRSGQSA